MKRTIIILVIVLISSNLYLFSQKKTTENDSISCAIPSFVFDDIEFYEKYAPLDSVPNWVKRKVTSKEYKLWKKLSRYFFVDHTVLLNDELNEKQKEELYNEIKRICKEVEEGVYNAPIHVRLTLNNLSLKTTLCHKWKIIERTLIDEHLSYNKISCMVYQAQKDKNAGMKTTVWYTYNDITKDMNVINFVLSPADTQQNDEKSNTFYRYQKTEKKFYGYCSGTISYLYNGENIKESYQTNFTFYPDKMERWIRKGWDF